MVCRAYTCKGCDGYWYTTHTTCKHIILGPLHTRNSPFTSETRHVRHRGCGQEGRMSAEGATILRHCGGSLHVWWMTQCRYTTCMLYYTTWHPQRRVRLSESTTPASSAYGFEGGRERVPQLSTYGTGEVVQGCWRMKSVGSRRCRMRHCVCMHHDAGMTRHAQGPSGCTREWACFISYT